MSDWNVVVTVAEKGFSQAFKTLGRFGELRKTDFYNVLVMQVDDIRHLTDELKRLASEDPESLSFLTRVSPVTHTFNFQSVEEFEKKAGDVLIPWVSRLEGKGFHVRIHRRGFKGRLSSVEEEKFLDGLLLEELEKAGSPGHITFKDPDAVVLVETVGTRAGLSIWTHEELAEFPLLGDILYSSCQEKSKYCVIYYG